MSYLTPGTDDTLYAVAAMLTSGNTDRVWGFFDDAATALKEINRAIEFIENQSEPTP